MEPERKIEKLLRAFAKKRRADAGDAFKLHPATRRMLHGEAARRAPKPDGEKDLVSLWDLFRERWAVLLGFALIIFFGAALFLPALSKSKNKAQSAEAVSNLKQLGAAAQIAAVDNRGKLPATLDALTNELGSDRALTDTVSGQRFVYVAGGANVDALQSNDVLAYSPDIGKDRAVLFADGSVHRVRREEFSALTNRTLLALAENAPVQKMTETPATFAVAAPVPAVAPPVAGEPGIGTAANRTLTTLRGSASGTVATTGEFAAAVSSDVLTAETLAAQNSTKFKSELATNSLLPGMNNSQKFVQIATKKNPPVLASFEMQQNGSTISVVDHDGSIYNGTLQPAGLALQDDLSKAKELADKRAGQSDLGMAGNVQSPTQNYFFRVSGASRSLKQNVVFVGNLLAISNAAATAVQNFGGTGGRQLQTANVKVAPPPLFSNSRITGTVTIGNTNQIEINAMPASP